MAVKSAPTEPLAHIMKALGNPVRLELLRQLTTPRQLGDIKVSPHRKEAGGAPKRWMSRASVQAHLEQLLDVGAVRLVNGVREGRSVTLYRIDERQLFGLTEELRDLGRLHGQSDVLDGTAPAPTERAAAEGPRLVLLNGPLEGQVYSLGGGGPWTIGRDGTSFLRLAYDPYLSKQNSEIRQKGNHFHVVDLPAARNGTSVNWRAIARGESAKLHSGDVVGVGRTLVLFRTD